MKKSQIQLGESIAVIMVFVVIMVFAGIFYLGTVRSSIDKSRDINQQQKAAQILLLASSLPEIKCSQTSVVNLDCVDLFKLNATEKVMKENRAFYYDDFGYSSIYVQQIFPVSQEEESWVLYNNTKEDSALKSRIFYQIPIKIYHPISEKYSFGLLVVEVYSYKT